MTKQDAKKPARKAEKNSNNLTRSDLAKTVSQKSNLPRAKVDEVITHVLETIASTVNNGGAVRLNGFGSFVHHISPSRIGRNPKTGETVTIPVRKSMKFRTAANLKKI